ncbi:hypothetical protein KW790_01905 [Candidatus Parcubacteria bacterium]|nr:hypothetical protein [Candidatus Parcubacteria bacterium]
MTKEKYEELMREDDRADREGIESERMLRERGVQAGLPKHLKEILDKKIPGYTPSLCCILQLKHSLMGFFPAIVTGTKIIVITLDIELIFRVWMSLEPEDSMLNESLFYVNEEFGVAYPAHDMSEFGQKESRPHKLFKAEEINGLFEKNAKPFKWASGLWGADVTRKQFEQIIEDAARRYNVSLPV